jgi:hypothetical protein
MAAVSGINGSGAEVAKMMAQKTQEGQKNKAAGGAAGTEKANAARQTQNVRTAERTGKNNAAKLAAGKEDVVNISDKGRAAANQKVEATGAAKETGKLGAAEESKRNAPPAQNNKMAAKPKEASEKLLSKTI